MSYPILYKATETGFDHNGIGILSACVSCEVTEEANGIFELAMTYPVDGIHFECIAERSIIKAKSDQFHDPQLFRVYKISKPMSGIVSISAQHISYDLSGIAVSPFYAHKATDALDGLAENAVIKCPFEFWTDKNVNADFTVKAPASIRSRLGGVAGSILDVYGGEYEFDNFFVNLYTKRGKNRGVSIRYGKNLTDIKQEQNFSSMCTAVYPYWTDSEGAVLVQLPEKIVHAPGTYDFQKVFTLDLSSDFEEQPTEDQIRNRTERYIKDNNVGAPSVSLTVSFKQLAESDEYRHMDLLDKVALFDTVNVEFPALGVSSNSRVVKVVYDSLAERVNSVTLGSIRSNIADTVAQQSVQIVETAKSEALRALNSQTAESLFNKLTNNGQIQGIYTDGQRWYLNAEIAKIINLVAEVVKSTGELGESIVDDGGIFVKNRMGEYVFSLINNQNGVFMTFNDERGEEVGAITSSSYGFGVRAYDLDTGEIEGYRLFWKNINGNKTLVGIS